MQSRILTCNFLINLYRDRDSIDPVDFHSPNPKILSEVVQNTISQNSQKKEIVTCIYSGYKRSKERTFDYEPQKAETSRNTSQWRSLCDQGIRITCKKRNLKKNLLNKVNRRGLASCSSQKVI